MRAPGVKVRDNARWSMRENPTTFRRELGQIPAWDAETGALMTHLEGLLGSLEPAALPDEDHDREAKPTRTHIPKEWPSALPESHVKVAASLHVVQCA